MRASAVLLAIVSSAAVIAACGTGGNGGPDNPQTISPSDVPSERLFPNEEPTGTPTGPIFLTDISSDDGTNVTTAGECLGFTIRTTEYEFLPGASIDLGGLMPAAGEDWTVTYIGPQELRVGDTSTGYTCEWLKQFNTHGTFDLTITSGTDKWTVPAAIKVNPLKFFDVGSIAETRIFTMAKVFEPDANVFERPYDVDIYRMNVLPAVDESSHVFSHSEFFTTGEVGIRPVMEFWDPTHTTGYLGRGGFGVVFPMRGVKYLVVKDSLGSGGPGATYDVATIRKRGKQTTPSDNCHDAPSLVPAEARLAYYADYDRLTNNFEPNCADTVYGSKISGPGNDGVWKITIPAGKTLRVSTYDDHIDNVTYLLPVSAMTTDTNGCPRTPTTCTAAAGRFGGGNTDTMIYRNLTGSDEEYFLIHDSATVMTSGVGSFLMNVEFFDR